jgi:hypothetical protein
VAHHTCEGLVALEVGKDACCAGCVMRTLCCMHAKGNHTWLIHVAPYHTIAMVMFMVIT